MKILTLNLEGYKNLTDKTLVNFDFTNCTNHIALIGLNGSGKSNILEAISEIFSSLYHDKTTSINYEITYSLNGGIVTVSNGKLSTESQPHINKKDYHKYLPSNVIASYSGEELRMWKDIYFQSYSQFFREIRNSKEVSPKLLYLNKYVWDFALIALLCEENPKIEKFLKNILKIDSKEVTINFNFQIDDKKVKAYPTSAALRFITELNSLQIKNEGKLTIDQIQVIAYQILSPTNISKEIFYSLFITGMPEVNKKAKIYAQKLIESTTINFNKIDVKKLSEGEKKLILIHTITDLLADDKTLILLDEPDAHIHIERKKEVIDIIDSNNHFTLFTTHSPTILHYVKDENVRIVRDTKDKGVEVIKLDKMKALAVITNNEFTLIDATLVISSNKPLLLVEGKGDVAYINKAINVLLPKNQLDIDILPFGGAANGKDFIDEIIKCIPSDKTVIVLFDRDDAGRDGMKDCINFSGGKMNFNTYKKDNCIFLMLPKTQDHAATDFLIEDYFSKDKKNALATKHITEANGAYNNFPKDLKLKIKEDLSKDLALYSRIDMSGFQVLIDKLINIIEGTEPFENELINEPKSNSKQ